MSRVYPVLQVAVSWIATWRSDVQPRRPWQP